MNAELRAELQRVLRTLTPLHSDVADFPELRAHVAALLTDRIPPNANLHDYATAMVFEAALRHGDPGQPNDDGEPTDPLCAAKHLLALGYYPDVMKANVPDTELSLEDFNRRMGLKPVSKRRDPRRLLALGLRQTIAVAASHMGTDRGVFKVWSRRSVEVAQALLDAMGDLAAEPDAIQKLELRIAEVRRTHKRKSAGRRHRGQFRPELVPTSPSLTRESPFASISRLEDNWHSIRLLKRRVRTRRSSDETELVNHIWSMLLEYARLFDAAHADSLLGRGSALARAIPRVPGMAGTFGEEEMRQVGLSTAFDPVRFRQKLKDGLIGTAVEEGFLAAVTSCKCRSLEGKPDCEFHLLGRALRFALVDLP